MIKRPLLHSHNNKKSKVYETAYMNPSQSARLPLAIIWYHIKKKKKKKKHIAPEAN